MSSGQVDSSFKLGGMGVGEGVFVGDGTSVGMAVGAIVGERVTVTDGTDWLVRRK